MTTPESKDNPFIRQLEEVSRDDTALVGGKNASLGEMIQKLHDAGIRVPGGFATTAAAYWHLIDANDLRTRLSHLLNQAKGEKRRWRAADVPSEH
jgi:pyruvate,water dikinase